jgi:endonuclease YncB( thermonuclease family)
LAPCRRFAAWCRHVRSRCGQRLGARAAGSRSACRAGERRGRTHRRRRHRRRARPYLARASLTVRVRIEGVDAPETRSACEDERRLAISARDFLTRRLLNREITLLRVVYDKFGGRVRAEISDSDGDIGQALLAAGLARPYGGERREPWCATG